MIFSVIVPLPFDFLYLRKKSKVNPLIVNYHIVSDRGLPHIKHLYQYRNTIEFRRDLDFFQENYTLIGLSDLLESIRKNRPLPPDALLLTFDDGFKEIYEIVAPALQVRGMTATFFLTVDFIDNRSLNHSNKQSLLIEKLVEKGTRKKADAVYRVLKERSIPGKDARDCILKIPYKTRHLLEMTATILEVNFMKFLEEQKPYLTTEQVRELIGKGFTIGAHSIDHARYNELTVEEQINQTLSSVDWITDRFSLDYRVFAFPYSDLGVGMTYFKDVSGKVDCTFGTEGLLSDPVCNNYQRINVEKFRRPGKQTVKYHYARRIIYDLFGRAEIARKY